jgi:hypothetical protein
MALIDDIRVDIGDDGATQTFTNAQLSAILDKAARRVNRVLSLTGSEAVILSSGVFTQPTETDELRDLVLLQAECMIANRQAAGDIIGGAAGIIVRDGEQMIDTTDQASAVSDYFDSRFNPCAELEQAYKIALMNRAGDEGRMVW